MHRSSPGTARSSTPAVINSADEVSVYWSETVMYCTAQPIVEKTMPSPSPNSLICVCGPPAFMAAVSGDKSPDYKQGPVAGLLKEAGYFEDMVLKF